MDTSSLPRNSPQEFLGVGFYSVGDAARLLRMPALSIRRWLTGYRFMRKGELHEVPPLWVPDLPKVDNTIELSFRDLIELRFVHQFTRAGVGLKAIRNCLDYARTIVESDRPFLSSRFRTDGRTIFIESAAKASDDDAVLLDLKRHQYAIKRVIEQSFQDLDIEADEVARWRPYRGKDTIVLDPERSFGQPIATDSGVPTTALAEAVVAEGSAERVAALYEVTIEVVRDAVRFESELRVT
ncbi:MAG: hypothetical protein IPK28_19595 [Devosia sp.]|nr:hypothetical protein [Devosia sp.]